MINKFKAQINVKEEHPKLFRRTTNEEKIVILIYFQMIDIMHYIKK